MWKTKSRVEATLLPNIAGTLSVEMALILHFLVLLYQADSFASQCIANCDPESCTGKNCTKCAEHYFMTSSEYCIQCFIHCRNCDGMCYRCAYYDCESCTSNCPSNCNSSQYNIPCSNCPDGYYLSGSFCYPCMHTGCKCLHAVNCIDCLPGKYGISNNCQNSCPIDCVTCTGQNACTECVTGKYGTICQSDCVTKCQDGTCDKTYGNCSEGCLSNYYLDPAKGCKICPNRCSSCIDYDHCTSCNKAHFWGPYCQYDCVSCSGDCEKDNGCPSGCANKYYKQYSAIKSGYECYRCPETCATCHNAVNCINCEIGYWGSYCQHNCTGCPNDCNKDDGCGEKCILGYYPHHIDNGYLCKKCLENCIICTNENTCENCKQGYFVADSKTCENCPDICINSSCDTKDGTCTEGCIVGLSGQRCGQECPEHCLRCEQFKASSCKACKAGFYGDSCTSKCNNCKQSVCFQQNGTCEYGCAEGFTGVSCVANTGLQCSSQENNTTSTVNVALAFVTGIAVLVAAVAVVVIVILLKRGRFDIMHKEGNGSSHISREQELDNNDYQDLHRNQSEDGAYSSVTQDYENAL